MISLSGPDRQVWPDVSMISSSAGLDTSDTDGREPCLGVNGVVEAQ